MEYERALDDLTVREGSLRENSSIHWAELQLASLINELCYLSALSFYLQVLVSITAHLSHLLHDANNPQWV